MDRIRITDVAPRDGLQNEPGVVATADKVRLIEMLAAAGVDEVEATSFVSAKWVPQLGDAEEVLSALRADAARRADEARRAPEPSPSGGGLGEGSPLLPNTRRSRSVDSARRARELRRQMTPPEVALWSRLRNDQIEGARFRRQHPIGRYIADFYCPAARLVVEVDGGANVGSEKAASDTRRQVWLESIGLHVERFTADDVLRHIDGVVARIRDEVVSAARLNTSRSPLPGPPPGGEGALAADRGKGLALEEAQRARRPVYSALVPNEKGFERALAFHSADFPLKIAVFTAASETFNTRNTNATIAESVERFRAFLPRALDAGMQVRFYISCAVACPFEGETAPSTVRRVAEQLIELVPEDLRSFERIEMDLGDTIGVATPDDIRALLGEFDDDAWRDLLVLHLHDTFGRAVECARAGIERGVWSFDSSVAGLGGCPYAGTPERRAPGNVSTAALVDLAAELGLATSIDPDALEEAAAFARQIVGKARAEARA